MTPEHMRAPGYTGTGTNTGTSSAATGTSTPYLGETNQKGWAGPMLMVSEDTLRRALHAIEVAKGTVEATGSDQYSATFLQDDGKLGGKVVYDSNGFSVDFDLFGQEARRPGGVG
jgi:hypothetical protein